MVVLWCAGGYKSWSLASLRRVSSKREKRPSTPLRSSAAVPVSPALRKLSRKAPEVTMELASVWLWGGARKDACRLLAVCTPGAGGVLVCFVVTLQGKPCSHHRITRHDERLGFVGVCPMHAKAVVANGLTASTAARAQGCLCRKPLIQTQHCAWARGRRRAHASPLTQVRSFACHSGAGSRAAREHHPTL